MDGSIAGRVGRGRKVHMAFTWRRNAIACRFSNPPAVGTVVCDLAAAQGHRELANALHRAGVRADDACKSCFTIRVIARMRALDRARETPCEDCGAGGGETCRAGCATGMGPAEKPAETPCQQS